MIERDKLNITESRPMHYASVIVSVISHLLYGDLPRNPEKRKNLKVKTSDDSESIAG